MKTPSLLVLLVTLAFAAGDVARFTSCKNGVDQSQCNVSEMRVTPCNGKRNVCRIKRGRDVNLSFDFTPNFAASEVKTAAYYVQGEAEVIFEELGIADACTLATCPLTAGTKNVFNYNLHIGKLLPPGQFPLRWKVWNAADESQICCFETAIRLV